MFQRVPWAALHNHIALTWKQGQHFVVCAPTGRGKTVFIKKLLPIRSNVVFFGTKIKDEEYDSLNKEGYARIQTWPPRAWQDRVMLWPRPERTIASTTVKQQQVFLSALDSLYRRGNWTVVFDELHWMANDLGLYKPIASLHHQGRSSNLTFIDGFQRPAYVPRIVYSSASHLAVWGTNDPSDLKQLSAFTGISVREWQEVMPTLDEFEFVYVNIRNRKVPPVISQVRR
jgi:hypothetical protein